LSIEDAPVTKSPQYRRLEQLWQEGQVVLLDGGVGSEHEQLGFPGERNIGELWGTRALYEAPELTREVHRRYVRAGADVITTNTWRIDWAPTAEASGLVSGTPGGWQEKVSLAVELAREAAAELDRSDECAVAFSVWPEVADVGFLEELAGLVKAAGPDLILAETMERIPVALEFPEYELLLETGLPLWVSYRWCRDGPCDIHGIGIKPARGPLQTEDGELFGRAAQTFERMGISAVLINCLPRDRVVGTLPLLRRFTDLPLGAYPNVGRYLDPGWQFDETAAPEAYAAEALRWRDDEGAVIVGGCCGVGAEHIAALAAALR
jgi:S-methylmethionine-dependent homocysteine/selenocysteine methylase